MLATGSIKGGEKNEVFVIDIENATNTCENLPSYPLEVYGATGGVMNGSPLICGGYTGRKIKLQKPNLYSQL